jgi:hypothetical protein
MHRGYLTYHQRTELVCAGDKVGWGYPFQGDDYPWRIDMICAGDKFYPRRTTTYAPAILGLIPGIYACMR